MHGGEDRDPSGAQRADQISHLQLPPDVEVLGRFVEEKKLRLLGETERDLDPLTLPSAQLIEDAAAERSRTGKIRRLLDCGAVGSLQPPKHSEERGPALFDELLDCKCERYVNGVEYVTAIAVITNNRRKKTQAQ